MNTAKFVSKLSNFEILRLKSKLLFLLFISFVFATGANSQEIVNDNSSSQDASKIFEKPNPQEEIYRLEDKKSTLNSRLIVLKEDEVANSTEIMRMEGMISYIDRKIESLQKIMNSEQYAIDMDMPIQGDMTDEQYRQKKEEWRALQIENSSEENQPEMEIKTTLTRYEFEKLPKDRQEKILSMPERYTIID